MRRFATSDSVTSPKRTGKFCFSTPARRATLKSHLLRLASTLSFSSQQIRWCIIIIITITWISSENWTSRRSMERWELKFRLTVRIVREKSKINAAPCVWALRPPSRRLWRSFIACHKLPLFSSFSSATPTRAKQFFGSISASSV